MHHGHRAGVEEVRREIPVGHGVDAVLAHPFHPEFPGHEFPVDRVRVRCPPERARAEGRDVHPPTGIPEPLLVPREHFVVGEQVMGKQDRLGPLDVRVAGHDDPEILLRARPDRLLGLVHQQDDVVDRVSEVQAQIQCHLVVPAPRGVELPADLSQPLGQDLLHRHVDVFLGKVERDLPRLDLLPDGTQGGCDPGGLFLRDDLLFPEHPRMRDASPDIVPVEKDVVGDRGRELLDERIDLPLESAAPRFLLLRHVSASFACASPGS